MTESYFGLNDFFPFNRAELMTAEPAIYELMQAIWGPVAGAAVKSVGKRDEFRVVRRAPGRAAISAGRVPRLLESRGRSAMMMGWGNRERGKGSLAGPGGWWSESDDGCESLAGRESPVAVADASGSASAG